MLCVGPVVAARALTKGRKCARRPFNQTKTNNNNKNPCERPGAQVATTDIIRNVVFLFLLSVAAAAAAAVATATAVMRGGGW